MNKKLEEYILQLDKKIARIEEKLDVARKDLTSNVYNVDIALNFSLTKYAEKVTKLTSQLEVLYEQKETFEYIFQKELENL